MGGRRGFMYIPFLEYHNLGQGNLTGGHMHEMIKVLKALSDPKRLTIVKMLHHREHMCVCEMQSVLGITQPSVSKHLKVLENAGVVEPERDGVWVNYSLQNIQQGSELEGIIDAILLWMDRDEETVLLLKRVDDVDRNNIINTEKSPK